MNTILEGVSRLEKGVSVLIFPEGGRMNRDSVHDFKAGSFKLATKANVPIMPIAIKGSDELLELKKRFAKAKVRISFGKPIHPHSEDLNKTVQLKAFAQKAIQDMYENL